MKRAFLCLLFLCLGATLVPAAPLRVFIRAGEKTHGPGEHDHPQFLTDWKKLLNDRGAQADGALAFPTAAQLEATDVLVLFAAEAGTITPEQRVNLDKFLKRGGGIVAIHDGVCGKDAPWFQTVIGGAWEHGKSKFFEGGLSLYYLDRNHPITQDASNFDFDDEMYYDLRLQPDAHVLAATYEPDKRNTRNGKPFPSVYEIAPQMWTYEKDSYRAFAFIPGHKYSTFSLPQLRAVLLRGIAWAGKQDVSSLCAKEELAALRYPEGGPTAPEKAVAQIHPHPDFTVNLVAAEPLIEKPISLDWDARGRLWVAETPEYPGGRKISAPGDKAAVWANPGAKLNAEGIVDRPARDRISVLEDTNGDGVMDKKTVFHDGLELVTSFVPYRDGVIVAQSPEIYFIRDTDGDGKSDQVETLYTGFGTRDTHAVLSNLRWQMDGWVYATVGYSGGEIKSGDGQKAFGSVGTGVIRFRPDGSALEQYSSKGGNTWGMDVAPDGDVFFTQANGDHCLQVVLPESVLARGKFGNVAGFQVLEDHKKSYPIRGYDNQAYVQVDHVGGFTAASGCTIYNGGAWPAIWNGTHYVSEPTVNLVHQDVLKPSGVTYVAGKDPQREEKEFIASDDLWFRPIHARVGPDGALYVLDFYNQAVAHNDTRGPFHGANNAAMRPDRDHHFGRIWRVQAKSPKTWPLPNLAKASTAELIEALTHPNGWVRQTAERLLVEKGI